MLKVAFEATSSILNFEPTKAFEANVKGLAVAGSWTCKRAILGYLAGGVLTDERHLYWRRTGGSDLGSSYGRKNLALF